MCSQFNQYYNNKNIDVGYITYKVLITGLNGISKHEK